MLCRTTSHDSSSSRSSSSSVGLSCVNATKQQQKNPPVDLGPAQPMLFLRAWYKGRNPSHGADQGQCSSGRPHIGVDVVAIPTLEP
jgi:hypothetical protein